MAPDPLEHRVPVVQAVGQDVDARVVPRNEPPVHPYLP
jgi:hypothetical protein